MQLIIIAGIKLTESYWVDFPGVLHMKLQNSQHSSTLLAPINLMVNTLSYSGILILIKSSWPKHLYSESKISI